MRAEEPLRQEGESHRQSGGESRPEQRVTRPVELLLALAANDLVGRLRVEGLGFLHFLLGRAGLLRSLVTLVSLRRWWLDRLRRWCRHGLLARRCSERSRENRSL